MDGMSNEVPPLKESRLQQRLNPTCIEQIQLHESFRDITNLRADGDDNKYRGPFRETESSLILVYAQRRDSLHPHFCQTNLHPLHLTPQLSSCLDLRT